jgi:tRNA pseudouridine38-40 synthase
VAHWKLTLTYDGSGFHGWQVQPGLVTVQSSLSDAIERITGERLHPQGSGRTDAGVHALAQVASFSLAIDIPAANFQRALNRVLPQGIRVLSAELVEPRFHARHSALRKTYQYRIFERRAWTPAGHLAERICSPFLAPYAWDCRWPLHLDRMNAAAAHFAGEHDFASFAATDPDRAARAGDAAPSSTVRSIFSAAWSREDGLLHFRVTGNGFLHHMIRNLVGTMVDVGRGSYSPDDMPRLLAARDRTLAGPTAPARGLFLVSVEYP